jgi:tellurite resistance protein TehA-like permease
MAVSLTTTLCCVSLMVVQKDKASASEKEFAKKWDSTVSSTGFVTFSTLASKAVRYSNILLLVLWLSQYYHCNSCFVTTSRLSQQL